MNDENTKTAPETAQAAPAAEATPVDSGNLTAWLSDPRTAEFFGESFALKAEVLACLIQRGNLAEVARRRRVSRSATSKQARRARTIFGGLAT